MEPTPEVTVEPTPTITLTPTATFTPTPDVWIEVTTEAGAAARVGREVTVGDYMTNVLLFTILVSLWLMFVLVRLSQKKGGN